MLVKVGGGKVRSKHSRGRMNLVSEAFNEKRVIVKHIQALEMIADGLFKTLHGADFDFFINWCEQINRWRDGYETKPQSNFSFLI
jgi:hypothetical protein